MNIQLETLPDMLSIIKLPAGSEIPAGLCQQGFYSITASNKEVSIVCNSAFKITSDSAELSDNWRGLKVRGTMAHDLVGVMATLSADIAAINVSLFAISTYDTDYILVQKDNLDDVIKHLCSCGHGVEHAQ
ncbi:MAG: hypothetical protein ACJA0N_002566 [Pseudohongiellaceae bacterium]|jgi:hypothetical protein